jgi:hypothetical protein
MHVDERHRAGEIGDGVGQAILFPPDLAGHGGLVADALREDGVQPSVLHPVCSVCCSDGSCRYRVCSPKGNEDVRTRADEAGQMWLTVRIDQFFSKMVPMDQARQSIQIYVPDARCRQ